MGRRIYPNNLALHPYRENVAEKITQLGVNNYIENSKNEILNQIDIKLIESLQKPEIKQIIKNIISEDSCNFIDSSNNVENFEKEYNNFITKLKEKEELKQEIINDLLKHYNLSEKET